jgi:hypothetical protein
MVCELECDRLLEMLSDPGSYPEPTERVERIETHISWVFLTDRFAYKLKKPVDYEFLDYSTVERRQWACEQEVVLTGGWHAKCTWVRFRSLGTGTIVCGWAARAFRSTGWSRCGVCRQGRRWID